MLHEIVRRGKDEMLEAALRSLLSGTTDAGDDVFLRPGASDLVEVLLASDGSGRVVVDELYERVESTDSTFASVFEALKNSQELRPFLKRVPLFPPRLHICGPGGAGKTLLRHQILGESAKARQLMCKTFVDGRTRGVEIMRGAISRGGVLGFLQSKLIVHLFDHGGQQEFQVTYSSMLTQPLSIFVLVIPVDTTGDDERKATNPAESAVELRYWLSLLETVAHEVNQVVVVANIFAGTSPRDRDNHVRQLRVGMNQYEGDRAQDSEMRVNFVAGEPIVLDASSNRDWRSSGKLLQHLQDAWKALQSIEKDGHIDLTMPSLCQPLFEAIPRLQEQDMLLQDAPSALAAVRRELGNVVDGLSDASLEALLQYAEQCGEIILGKERERLGIVVWDPNWFATTILGEFFQPANWRRNLLRRRNKRMQRQDVIKCLEQIISDDGRAQADEELLSRVLALLQQMRLCIPIGSGGEEWFPAFLNSAEKHAGFDEEMKESLKREETTANELLLTHLDTAPPSALVCGRLLLLMDRSQEEGATPSDELTNVFPSGSFSRFQVRVLEAFSKPTGSNAEKKCDVSLNRNFVKLSWSGNDGEMCYFHSLMLHNNRGIKFAWIAWLWSTSHEAAADHFLEGRRGGGINAVMDQMVEWMKDACTIRSRTPALKEEKLRAPAFSKSKEALFKEWGKYFMESGGEGDPAGVFVISNSDGSVISRLDRIEGKVDDISRKLDRMLEKMDDSFDNVMKHSLQRPDLLEILESYQASIQRGYRDARIEQERFEELGLVPVATVMEMLEQQSSKQDQVSSQILEAIEDVKNAIQEKGSILETMVESVVHADSEIPFTALLLPQALARRLRDNFAGKPVSRWRRFKRGFSTKTSALSKPLYLYFFCPVTGHIMPSNGGRGFKLSVPQDWFLSVSPYLRALSALLNISIFVVGTALGLTAIATSLCRVLELPDIIPGSEDFFAALEQGVHQGQRLQQYLERMPDEAAKDRAAAVETRSRDLILDNPRAMKGDNYGRLVEMLNHLGVTVSLGNYGAVLGSGLALARGPRGEFMWVSEEDGTAAFEQQGIDALLPSVRESLPDHFRGRSRKVPSEGCEEKKGAE
eukprot:scaffold4318_cov182-Pinguiococcus_pyrenoidosus.AAC.1